jgi:hypothetical protein
MFKRLYQLSRNISGVLLVPSMIIAIYFGDFLFGQIAALIFCASVVYLIVTFYIEEPVELWKPIFIILIFVVGCLVLGDRGHNYPDELDEIEEMYEGRISRY